MRFVLIDRLLELEPGRRAVAVKTFGAGEGFFADHFPGHPVVPGVLLTEVMGQTAGYMLLPHLGFTRWPLLAMIDRARFRRPVLPDEPLRAETTLESEQAHAFSVRGLLSVEGERVAEARLAFHVFEAGELPADACDWARRTFRALGGEDLLAHGVGAA